MKAALVGNLNGFSNPEIVLKQVIETVNAGNFDIAVFAGDFSSAVIEKCQIPKIDLAAPGLPEFADAAGIRFLPFIDGFSSSGKPYRLQTQLGNLRRLGSSSPFPTVAVQRFELGEYDDLKHLLPAMSGYNCMLALAGTGKSGISSFGEIRCATAASLAEDHAFTSVVINSDGVLESCSNIELK